MRREPAPCFPGSLGAALAGLLVIQCLTSRSSAAETGDGGTANDEQDADNWPAYGRTFTESHFSPLGQINESSIKRLGLAWALDLDMGERADSQPLEVDGVLYVATGLSIVRAIDARSGRLLWRFDPQVAKAAADKLRAAWGIRGLAYWQGHAYVGTQDGRLIALDATTGHVVWSVMTLDSHDESTITGAPRVYNGKIVIGFAGGDRVSVRGALTCYDATNGNFLWRFYTVPDGPKKGFENEAMRMAAKTWTGDWSKYVGGGEVWNAITYDPQLNRLYIGTGNGSPWNWKIRNPHGGDNLFLASIVALDADTGSYVWHYQETPNDAWDYDSAMDIELSTITVDEKPRPVIFHAPKNGFFYVLDRVTGKVISAAKIGRVSWADHIDLATGRPVETPGVRYEKGTALLWPGPYGIHNWEPMSFSPETGLVYIPATEMAYGYDDSAIDRAKWKSTKNTWNIALSEPAAAPPTTGFSSSLLAWNPVTQKPAWRTETTGTLNGGTMATSGNLVFQGHMDGSFNAYGAASGALLWSFRAGVAVMGAPISYAIAGVQYVSVITGPVNGSAAATLPGVADFGWSYRGSPRRILTFALDATARLAATPPKPEIPVSDSSLVVDPKVALRGRDIYGANCMTCHGVNAVAGGGAPDLRASLAVPSAESFTSIVHDGALLAFGMPQFSELSNSDLTALQHYIRGRANEK